MTRGAVANVSRLAHPGRDGIEFGESGGDAIVGIEVKWECRIEADPGVRLPEGKRFRIGDIRDNTKRTSVCPGHLRIGKTSDAVIQLDGNSRSGQGIVQLRFTGVGRTVYQALPQIGKSTRIRRSTCRTQNARVWIWFAEKRG